MKKALIAGLIVILTLAILTVGCTRTEQPAEQPGQPGEHHQAPPPGDGAPPPPGDGAPPPPPGDEPPAGGFNIPYVTVDLAYAVEKGATREQFEIMPEKRFPMNTKAIAITFHQNPDAPVDKKINVIVRHQDDDKILKQQEIETKDFVEQPYVMTIEEDMFVAGTYVIEVVEVDSNQRMHEIFSIEGSEGAAPAEKRDDHGHDHEPPAGETHEEE